MKHLPTAMQYFSHLTLYRLTANRRRIAVLTILTFIALC